MTAPPEAPGAVAPCRSGRPPARTQRELLAALERERVRDPDALRAERYAPEPPEHVAGVYRPITTERAAENFQRLASALRAADTRRRWSGRPTSAHVAQTKHTSLTGARPAIFAESALTSTT